VHFSEPTYFAAPISESGFPLSQATRLMPANAHATKPAINSIHFRFIVAILLLRNSR
jgi:hypothetical protein